jgi:hypothetical protein
MSVLLTLFFIFFKLIRNPLLQLLDRSVTLEAGTIGSGKSVDVLHAGSRVAIRISLPGSAGGWSSALSLPLGQELAGSITAGNLEIRVESVVEDGARRVALWVPYWLLNSR